MLVFLQTTILSFNYAAFNVSLMQRSNVEGRGNIIFEKSRVMPQKNALSVSTKHKTVFALFRPAFGKPESGKLRFRSCAVHPLILIELYLSTFISSFPLSLSLSLLHLVLLSVPVHVDAEAYPTQTQRWEPFPSPRSRFFLFRRWKLLPRLGCR